MAVNKYNGDNEILKEISDHIVDTSEYAQFIEVALAEANPKNVGNEGRYKGVGAHLFSIASRLSFEKGYEGYVTFISKTDLVKHYIETLHAEILFDRNMQLNTEASEFLVKVYDKKARDMYEEK